MGLTESVLARLELWWNSLVAWLHSPVFGHGLGSFDAAYSPHRAAHKWFLDRSILDSPYTAAGMAHNVGLHALVEIGAIGAAIVAMFLFFTCRKGVTLAVVAAGAMAMIEFPEQNPATAMMIACALALSAKPQ